MVNEYSYRSIVRMIPAANLKDSPDRRPVGFEKSKCWVDFGRQGLEVRALSNRWRLHLEFLLYT
jgi:hypothetical protein